MPCVRDSRRMGWRWIPFIYPRAALAPLAEVANASKGGINSDLSFIILTRCTGHGTRNILWFDSCQYSPLDKGSPPTLRRTQSHPKIQHGRYACWNVVIYIAAISIENSSPVLKEAEPIHCAFTRYRSFSTVFYLVFSTLCTRYFSLLRGA
jgi:hypothetical protein